MSIHPLWIICLLTRMLVLIFSGYLAKNNNKYIKNILNVILFLIGLGFIYKFLSGSNDEIQIAKVFWHESRLIHGILFILASFYLYEKNSKMCMIVLGIDIIFSIMYRLFNNV